MEWRDYIFVFCILKHVNKMILNEFVYMKFKHEDDKKMI